MKRLFILLTLTIILLTGCGNTAGNSSPVGKHTSAPTDAPTVTAIPTVTPTEIPTIEPTVKPTTAPTVKPTTAPTIAPTVKPTTAPTIAPTVKPTIVPTIEPIVKPTIKPTTGPTIAPTDQDRWYVTKTPTPAAPTPPTHDPEYVASIYAQSDGSVIVFDGAIPWNWNERVYDPSSLVPASIQLRLTEDDKLRETVQNWGIAYLQENVNPDITAKDVVPDYAPRGMTTCVYYKYNVDGNGLSIYYTFTGFYSEDVEDGLHMIAVKQETRW